MEILKLMEEARAAGLVLIPKGDHLRIRGPKAAESLVQKLLEQKAAVLQQLHFQNLDAVSVTETLENSLKDAVSETWSVVLVPNHPLADFDWDAPGFCPTPPIIRDGVRHKFEGCSGRDSWQHVWGERLCLQCWPPTDPAAVVGGQPRIETAMTEQHGSNEDAR
jgi:hypothetical protein